MSDDHTSDMVNVHQAKTHLSKLLERAHAGEEIVIAKAGTPYARLVPLEAPHREPRVLGSYSELIPEVDDDAFFDPLPEEELAAWEAGSPE